ncbi:hypothetical protein HYH03_012644 [Edaphochlamys debaryana]|uniref:Uncharacterized protein n=1 Tax=Edaphochlamys debaryana TaxID=47281 RepID=A0A836BVA5_9CHLO|nr:hypothetical protein HYH03_012644 [Edaphochlamys debaryana]|eukprot:KAG2488848.1 hypothetical protein HYH03_012644 [Edaphochlamys debaryana]
MTWLGFQLRALRYPHGPVDVDADNPEAARKLVIWLENLKIREYKIEDRKPLADTASPTWGAAFGKYLSDLSCPVPSTDLKAAVEWLVAFAVNLEYEDNADKLPPPAAPAPAPAPAAPPAAKPAAPASSRGAQAFTDLADPATVAAVRELIRVAQVSEGAGIVDELQEAADLAVAAVGPALAAGGWTDGRAARAALAHVPLGFNVEGEALNRAAKALRLAYVQDLRRLQSQIDHALVEMQEYTANPKTDSSLGKVGR